MEMNLLDYGVVAIFVLYLLAGVYKGFAHAALSIGAFLLCWLLSFALLGVGARAVKNNARLYDMMLYYTEGSEYIINNVGVEEARLNIADLSTAQLNDIVTRADAPYPMDKEILSNVAAEAFAAQGVTTLGDYFNQTMVCVFINILVFILIFTIFRVILAFLLNGVDYAYHLPQLQSGDWILGGALGILRGVLTLFLLFMLMPVLLTVVGQFDVVKNIVEESFFAPFFYYSNFLLSLMPGT